MVPNEKEKMNLSTETMKIGPITATKDQEPNHNQTSLDQTRQSRLTDDLMTPIDQSTKLVQEVDVPQHIEIRHASANISPVKPIDNEAPQSRQ